MTTTTHGYWDPATLRSAQQQASSARRKVLLPPLAPPGPVKIVEPTVVAPKTPAGMLTAVTASGLRVAARLKLGKLDGLTVR